MPGRAPRPARGRLETHALVRRQRRIASADAGYFPIEAAHVGAGQDRSIARGQPVEQHMSAPLTGSNAAEQEQRADGLAVPGAARRGSTPGSARAPGVRTASPAAVGPTRSSWRTLAAPRAHRAAGVIERNGAQSTTWAGERTCGTSTFGSRAHAIRPSRGRQAPSGRR